MSPKRGRVVRHCKYLGGPTVMHSEFLFEVSRQILPKEAGRCKFIPKTTTARLFWFLFHHSIEPFNSIPFPHLRICFENVNNAIAKMHITIAIQMVYQI